MASPPAPNLPPKPAQSQSPRSSLFQPAELNFTSSGYHVVSDDQVGDRLVRLQRPPERIEERLERAREKLEDPASSSSEPLQQTSMRRPLAMKDGFLVRNNVFVNPSVKRQDNGSQSPRNSGIRHQDGAHGTPEENAASRGSRRSSLTEQEQTMDWKHER